MIKRINTKKVQVGNIQIGGNNKIIIQSMTTTKTKDIQSTIKQIHDLEKAGCELVRVAVLDIDDAKSIREIKDNINIPLVADIHFDYKLAIESINQGIDKVRINPGNIGSEENVKKVVDACILKNIPIRIGINSGSLEKNILDKYGHPTARGMIESAKYHVSLLEKFGFDNIIISLKSSDMFLTIKAYELAAKEFKYPLHLGITESGTKFSGTIKSSIGLGILINEGIGSTLRVSLATDPVDEIKVCKEILSSFNLIRKPKLICCPTCGRIQYEMFDIVNDIEDYLQSINQDIKVAIMGCGVNGPGEAKEADIGIAGGKNEGLLFIKGKVVKKIPKEDMKSVLKEEIDKYIKNRG